MEQIAEALRRLENRAVLQRQGDGFGGQGLLAGAKDSGEAQGNVDTQAGFRVGGSAGHRNLLVVVPHVMGVVVGDRVILAVDGRGVEQPDLQRFQFRRYQQVGAVVDRSEAAVLLVAGGGVGILGVAPDCGSGNLHRQAPDFARGQAGPLFPAQAIGEDAYILQGCLAVVAHAEDQLHLLVYRRFQQLHPGPVAAFDAQGEVEVQGGRGDADGVGAKIAQHKGGPLIHRRDGRVGLALVQHIIEEARLVVLPIRLHKFVVRVGDKGHRPVVVLAQADLLASVGNGEKHGEEGRFGPGFKLAIVVGQFAGRDCRAGGVERWADCRLLRDLFLVDHTAPARGQEGDFVVDQRLGIGAGLPALAFVEGQRHFVEIVGAFVAQAGLQRPGDAVFDAQIFLGLADQPGFRPQNVGIAEEGQPRVHILAVDFEVGLIEGTLPQGRAPGFQIDGDAQFLAEIADFPHEGVVAHAQLVYNLAQRHRIRGLAGVVGGFGGGLGALDKVQRRPDKGVGLGVVLNVIDGLAAHLTALPDFDAPEAPEQGQVGGGKDAVTPAHALNRHRRDILLEAFAAFGVVEEGVGGNRRSLIGVDNRVPVQGRLEFSQAEVGLLHIGPGQGQDQMLPSLRVEDRRAVRVVAVDPLQQHRIRLGVAHHSGKDRADGRFGNRLQLGLAVIPEGFVVLEEAVRVVGGQQRLVVPLVKHPVALGLGIDKIAAVLHPQERAHLIDVILLQPRPLVALHPGDARRLPLEHRQEGIVAAPLLFAVHLVQCDALVQAQALDDAVQAGAETVGIHRQATGQVGSLAVEADVIAGGEQPEQQQGLAAQAQIAGGVALFVHRRRTEQHAGVEGFRGHNKERKVVQGFDQPFVLVRGRVRHEIVQHPLAPAHIAGGQEYLEVVIADAGGEGRADLQFVAHKVVPPETGAAALLNHIDIFGLQTVDGLGKRIDRTGQENHQRLPLCVKFPHLFGVFVGIFAPIRAARFLATLGRVVGNLGFALRRRVGVGVLVHKILVLAPLEIQHQFLAAIADADDLNAVVEFVEIGQGSVFAGIGHNLLAVADAHHPVEAQNPIIRIVAVCVGKGGEAQAVHSVAADQLRQQTAQVDGVEAVAVHLHIGGAGRGVGAQSAGGHRQIDRLDDPGAFVFGVSVFGQIGVVAQVYHPEQIAVAVDAPSRHQRQIEKFIHSQDVILAVLLLHSAEIAVGVHVVVDIFRGGDGQKAPEGQHQIGHAVAFFHPAQVRGQEGQAGKIVVEGVFPGQHQILQHRHIPEAPPQQRVGRRISEEGVGQIRGAGYVHRLNADARCHHIDGHCVAGALVQHSRLQRHADLPGNLLFVGDGPGQGNHRLWVRQHFAADRHPPDVQTVGRVRIQGGHKVGLCAGGHVIDFQQFHFAGGGLGRAQDHQQVPPHRRLESAAVQLLHLIPVAPAFDKPLGPRIGRELMHLRLA